MATPSSLMKITAIYSACAGPALTTSRAGASRRAHAVLMMMRTALTLPLCAAATLERAVELDPHGVSQFVRALGIGLAVLAQVVVGARCTLITSANDSAE